MDSVRLKVWVDAPYVQAGPLQEGLRLGDIVSWSLNFFEGREDELSDNTVHAEAVPGPVAQTVNAMGHHTGAYVSWWPLTLRGEGWTAEWAATRPVEGRVEVTGQITPRLYDDDRTSRVRGVIRRLRVATSEFVRSPDSGNHEPQGALALRDVDRTPDEFADEHWDQFLELVRSEPDNWKSGHHQVPRPDRYRAEFGVLVDLDVGGS